MSVSGHKIEDLEEFMIFPAKHFVTPEDKLKEAMENIRLELNGRLQELKRPGKNFGSRQSGTKDKF